MARKLRVQYPGAIYHVMNRGDRREDIFRSRKDRELFLKSLGEACAKTDWQVHAFCLMSNHPHLAPKAFGADGRDAQSQPGGRDEMAAGHLHLPVQTAGQDFWASFQRTLPEPGRGWP